ncbi:MAG: hypothetical protein IT384_31750 [Deltaproteobacteria bacterium]|nr:hypothetical protein [Deltaproteobacteria bacterium]
MAPARMAAILARTGLVSEERLGPLLAEAKRTGRDLASLVVAHGLVSEERLLRTLSDLSGAPRLDERSLVIDPRAGRWMTRAWADDQRMVPLMLEPEGALVVAVSDPFDLGPLEELAFRAGVRVEPRLVAEAELRRLFEAVFGRRAPREADSARARKVRALLEAQERSARELQALFEACVDRGLIGRQEYLERLAQVADLPAAGDE